MRQTEGTVVVLLLQLTNNIAVGQKHLLKLNFLFYAVDSSVTKFFNSKNAEFRTLLIGILFVTKKIVSVLCIMYGGRLHYMYIPT